MQPDGRAQRQMRINRRLLLIARRGKGKVGRELVG
jgi:hypothetical protein